MSNTKYLHIYDYIKNNILNETFKHGTKLPSENSLKLQFNVSRNTIRRALQRLALEGLVSSVHGSGVFVMQKEPFSFNVGGLESFTETSLNNNLTKKTTIAIFEHLVCDNKLSNLTNFKVGANVLKIYRIRTIDNEDIILDINYFNTDLIKGITSDISKSSIYKFIENTLNLKISGAKKIISIEKASKDDIKYLNLTKNSLVAIITNYVYLEDGTLFEYTESRHKADRFTFKAFAKRLY